MEDLTNEQRRELISASVSEQGLTVLSWQSDEDEGEGREKAYLGNFRVCDDDEENGLYLGDEGVLHASVVGAPKYRNVRVHYSFMPEGYDSGNEVRDLDILESA